MRVVENSGELKLATVLTRGGRGGRPTGDRGAVGAGDDKKKAGGDGEEVGEDNRGGEEGATETGAVVRAGGGATEGGLEFARSGSFL